MNVVTKVARFNAEKMALDMLNKLNERFPESFVDEIRQMTKFGVHGAKFTAIVSISL